MALDYGLPPSHPAPLRATHPFPSHPALPCPACLPACQVIVVEDENGNIVRETMKDNDVLAQYKTMRETLIYLCHLDYEDTENQMLEKLRLQVGVTLAQQAA